MAYMFGTPYSPALHVVERYRLIDYAEAKAAIARTSRENVHADAAAAGRDHHSLAGMSFGRWRQQLAIMLAVKWMAEGVTIQQVAFDLGYESVPSFVNMFRKALGTPPGRYMAERHPGS